jgi:tetratricopeptide (TPR) repeat protein
MGNAHVLLGEWKRAIENYREAIDTYKQELQQERLRGGIIREREIYKQMEELYNNLGVACERIGDDREAMVAFGKALECASFARRTGAKARLNLNKMFEGKSLRVQEEIHHGFRRFY